MKKKFLSMLLTSIMVVGATSGCKNGNDNTDSTTGGTQANNTEATTKASNSGDKIVIKYAHWNLGTEEENNIERRMIEAYEAQNSHVDIQIADNIELGDKWISSLSTAAAGGQLPDIIALTNIPIGLSNDWLYNIKYLTTNDTDWSKMPEGLIDSATYANGIYAVPSAQQLGGYFVNTNLFEEENQPQPEFGYTFEEFESAIKSMTQLNKGIVGLSIEDQIMEWYPASKDSNLGWYTWDGEKFNLNNPLFSEGLKIAKDYNVNGNCFNGLSDAQKENFGVDNDGKAWDVGKTAMRWDNTSAASNMLANLPFEVEFIGIPGGKTVIIPDYIGITKTTKNPEETYNFAKWMTFSKEGIMKRMSIVEENGDVTWSSLPLIQEDEIIDRFFENISVKGIREAFDAADSSFVEAFKLVPGYVEARWQAPTGIKAGDKENATMGEVLGSCMKGELNIDDYTEQINKLANQIVDDASVKIKEVTK